MWWKKQHKLSKNILNLFCVGSQINFQWICGIVWSQKQKITCNLLHQSNVAPKVSSHVYAFGPHDFNRMPLAPMGCAVKIHENWASGERGVSTQSTDGTFRHLHTTIGVLRYGVNTQVPSEIWTLARIPKIGIRAKDKRRSSDLRIRANCIFRWHGGISYVFVF